MLEAASSANVMKSLAHLITHPAVVWSVVALLCFWAALSGASLWSSTRRVRAALDRASVRIEGIDGEIAFAKQYETLAEEMKNDRLLGPRWHEFDDSLILPRGNIAPVRSTTRPSQWFDLGLLRHLGVDLRYHAALPNLLVGAGLLFTFLGLAAALSTASDVVGGGTVARPIVEATASALAEPEQPAGAEAVSAKRNEALKTLLDTASFKFITSLFGLGLSLAYALHRKKCLKEVDSSLDRFNAGLERRVPLLTPVDVQRETNRLIEGQSDALQVFSNELAVNIGQAFDRAFDTRLGEHIAPLTEAMQKLAERMNTGNEDAMGRMLDGFLQRLQGGAGDRMQDVAASLEGLSGRLEGLQNGLGDAASRMAASADAMAARMGEGAQAALSRITDQMGGLVESLRSVAEETRGAGAEAGRELAGRMERAAGSFEEAARGVAATLSDAAAGLEARLGQGSEASAARLAAQVETMVGELRRLAETSRSAGAEAFASLAGRIEGAASGFEASAARVSDALGRAASDTGGALGRGAEEAVERIAAATEGMRSELKALIAEFREAAEGAGNTFREGGSAGAEAFRTALGGAGEGLAAALENAAGRLRDAGGDAASALERGGGAAAGALDRAGGSFGGQAESLGRQVAALTGGSEAIVVRLTEFNQAARDAAAPLAATASDLKAAGAAARNSVEPVAQAASALGRALEQFGGAASRIEATHGAAGRLAENLSAAAGRFEGVDRSLAGIFTQLQTGLQALRSQVESVTKTTDDNLAKAATQLHQLVSDLSATIEEFNDSRSSNSAARLPGGQPAGRR